MSEIFWAPIFRQRLGWTPEPRRRFTLSGHHLFCTGLWGTRVALAIRPVRAESFSLRFSEGVALCGARETAASAAGTKRKGHLRFPFLFELLPFPYLLARRKSESGDRSENGYGSRVTAAFVSQPIRSSRITHCYTYGLLSAGAANRAAQLVCLMATDGTCEFFCANTLYLIFSPLFTLFLQLHTKKEPEAKVTYA